MYRVKFRECGKWYKTCPFPDKVTALLYVEHHIKGRYKLEKVDK